MRTPRLSTRRPTPGPAAAVGATASVAPAASDAVTAGVVRVVRVAGDVIADIILAPSVTAPLTLVPPLVLQPVLLFQLPPWLPVPTLLLRLQICRLQSTVAAAAVGSAVPTAVPTMPPTETRTNARTSGVDLAMHGTRVGAMELRPVTIAGNDPDCRAHRAAGTDYGAYLAGSECRAYIAVTGCRAHHAAGTDCGAYLAGTGCRAYLRVAGAAGADCRAYLPAPTAELTMPPAPAAAPISPAPTAELTMPPAPAAAPAYNAAYWKAVLYHIDLFESS